MAKKSKAYRTAAALLEDGKYYTADEAVKIARQTGSAYILNPLPGLWMHSASYQSSARKIVCVKPQLSRNTRTLGSSRNDDLAPVCASLPTPSLPA